jgi:hypothetical protein
MEGTCSRHGEMRNAYRTLVVVLKGGGDLNFRVLDSSDSGWDLMWTLVNMLMDF